jgi:hypothetical protein
VTKEVQLTKGYVALVDDEDYELVCRHTWRAQVKKSGNVYAVTHIRKLNGRQTTLSMHRLIMGITEPGIQVDHVNGIGRDNRSSNMRACTNAENCQNKGAQKSNTSGVKGVSWYKRDKKWQAFIGANGKGMHLGCFNTKDDAAAAYQAAAVKYHGEFARFE